MSDFDFTDLETPADLRPENARKPGTAPLPDTYEESLEGERSVSTFRFEEPCNKCGGSGTFYS
jgi:hypothetical protein